MNSLPMSLVDRLIGRAVAGLPSRRGPVLGGVDAEGLRVVDAGGERFHRWDEVDCAVAASGAGVVGETVFLTLALTGSEPLVVPETDAHWPALVDGLGHLPGAAPVTIWRLRLVGAPDQVLEVYRRR